MPEMEPPARNSTGSAISVWPMAKGRAKLASAATTEQSSSVILRP